MNAYRVFIRFAKTKKNDKAITKLLVTEGHHDYSFVTDKGLIVEMETKTDARILCDQVNKIEYGIADYEEA